LRRFFAGQKYCELMALVFLMSLGPMSEARGLRRRWIGMASVDVVFEMRMGAGFVVPELLGLELILRLLVSSSQDV